MARAAEEALRLSRKAEVIDTLLTELRRLPEVRGTGYTYAGPLLGIIDRVGWFVPPGSWPPGTCPPGGVPSPGPGAVPDVVNVRSAPNVVPRAFVATRR